MRIAYFGDGLWATECLRALLGAGHQIVAVVVRRLPSDSTLETLAATHKLPVHQPHRVNAPEFVARLGEITPDLCVSMSYDQIFQQPIREIAPHGFINCHAGKLPFYRGRNPINWALINNEAEVGLTVHHVDEGIDTGDIVAQHTVPATWGDTYGSVLAKVVAAFPSVVLEAVASIERGAPRLKQNDPGTYFAARRPGDEWINWSDESLKIYNKIRAITHPGPGARTLDGTRPLIVWHASYDPQWPKYRATAGEVVGVVRGRGVQVKTGDSTVLVERIQYVGEEHEQVPAFRIGTRFADETSGRLTRLEQEIIELKATIRKPVGA
jgi:methionyl-tRNA formyltransferase